MKAITSTEYKTFFTEIKERIHKAQYDAFKAVNTELINLYWDIGRSIENIIEYAGAVYHYVRKEYDHHWSARGPRWQLKP